jgi:hypothetical protein
MLPPIQTVFCIELYDFKLIAPTTDNEHTVLKPQSRQKFLAHSQAPVNLHLLSDL